MDDKDRILIAMLSKDARRPIVALARDISLSRSATQDRLARLVASGAIAKFTIVEGQAGEARQTAHLLVKLEKGFKCAQVVPKIMACQAASAVHPLQASMILSSGLTLSAWTALKQRAPVWPPCPALPQSSRW
jgi:Lrp/AsnC family transcriptional regulator, leucine-responsive regulatory protein